MSSEPGQYNASFGTKTKMLKLRLSISNLLMILEDRVLTTKPVNLSLTQDVSLSLQLKTEESRESLTIIWILFRFKNNCQENKTIYVKTTGIIENNSGALGKFEDKSYCKYLVKANFTFQTARYSVQKTSLVENDSFTILVHLKEVIICESQQYFINDETEEETSYILASLYSEDNFKDTKFVIQGKSLMAHKAVITTRSKVFRAMLTHDTKEKANGIIEIKDVSFDTFEPFIKYLYTNRVDEEKVGDEMLQLADKYDVQSLRSRCEKIISQRIDETNAVRYLIEADTCNFQLLKSRALEVISGQLKKIRKTEEFKLLSPHPHLLEAIYDRYLNEDEVIECQFTSAPLQSVLNN